jgi:SlyX protein
MDGSGAEKRLVELELRYTQQQDLLQQLSDALWAQQRALDALRAEVGWLRTKLAAFEPGLTEGPPEKPPHY